MSETLTPREEWSRGETIVLVRKLARLGVACNIECEEANEIYADPQQGSYGTQVTMMRREP